MKGYKAFNEDMTCRGFQYDIGKTYTHDGKIELCGSGFHFCINPRDCFGYYPLESRLCEVEAFGYVEGHPDEKMVTNAIRIVREVPEVEKCRMYHSNGDGNGNGHGDGNGNGHGDGNGYGYGNGHGYGNGYGYGNGDGNGYGNGDGNGYGDGNGNGYGENIQRVLTFRR